MRWLGLARRLSVLLILGAAGGAVAAGSLRLGDFTPSAEPGEPPPGWEALTFPRMPRHTRYTVVRDGDGWVLRAEADASASGLYRPLDLDPRIYRRLSWRWRIEGVLAGSDPRRREGDDYVARVYVAFRYDPDAATLWQRSRYGIFHLLYGRYPPELALSYVWESRLPVGTVLDSAYTDRAKIVVVRSGPDRVGRWVSETRDLYEDYRRIVGREPPRIAGVALMTDTDDTGEHAVAYYDAITLGPGDPDR
jgi:hypothetical protein